MKKLFLQSGKLMIGEFPEEPFSYCGCEMCERHKRERFDESVESAKASAVEVVNTRNELPIAVDGAEDMLWNINGKTERIIEGQLYDLPSGWTVEDGWDEPCIKVRTCLIADHENNDNCAQLHGNICQKKKQIARLIPSENAQGETGIVATGIAEVGQRKRKPAPEKIGSDLLKNVIETVPESGEKPEQSWSERMDQMAKEVAEIAEQGRPVYGTVLGALHEVNAKNNHFIEQLKECIEEKDATIEALVSPPTQAESRLAYLERQREEIIGIVFGAGSAAERIGEIKKALNIES